MTSPEDEDDLVVEMLSGPLGLSFAPVCPPWKANHQMVNMMVHGEASPRELCFGSPSPVCPFSLFRSGAGPSLVTVSEFRKYPANIYKCPLSAGHAALGSSSGHGW